MTSMPALKCDEHKPHQPERDRHEVDRPSHRSDNESEPDYENRRRRDPRECGQQAIRQRRKRTAQAGQISGSESVPLCPPAAKGEAKEQCREGTARQRDTDLEFEANARSEQRRDDKRHGQDDQEYVHAEVARRDPRVFPGPSRASGERPRRNPSHDGTIVLENASLESDPTSRRRFRWEGHSPESRSGSRRLSSVTRESRTSFIDPRPALEKDFEAARARLRQARGPSKTLLGAFRLFMAERRLHYEIVTKPLRSAHW